MKKMHRFSRALAILLLALGFSSFNNLPSGGDSFTIHLNNKLLLQQFLHGYKAVKTISLEGATVNDELRVSFSHCGTVGNAKTLTLKDQKGLVLKQWRFTDAIVSMTCKVKEIISLENGENPLRLFYSSAELPKGLVLVNLQPGGISTVKK